MNLKSKFARLGVVAALAAPLASFAQTAPGTVTTTGTGALATLLAGVSFVDVIATIFAVGIAVIAIDMAMIGYMKVRRLVKGAH